MKDQEILGMDSALAAAKEMPYGANMPISAALVIEMVERIAELEAFKRNSLSRLSASTKYIDEQVLSITGLEKELQEAREICDAVAHVGVDFGYGTYVLEDSIIHRARLLIEALKESKL